MNYDYQSELKELISLVSFKQYHRYGDVLYARYGVMKPEVTISELAWGFCHNPCFANRLAADLAAVIPNREKFSVLMAKSNRLIETKFLNNSFDQAMRQVCCKTGPKVLLAYSTESTNMKDRTTVLSDGSAVETVHATDEDGEMWHGLVVENAADWNKVDSIKIAIKLAGEVMWQHTYNRASVIKNTKTIKDVTTFTPFKHPLVLLNLGIEVETQIFFEREPETDVHQIFGVGSNDYCSWLSETAFEIKLCKKNKILVDMPKKTITFRV